MAAQIPIAEIPEQAQAPPPAPSLPSRAVLDSLSPDDRLVLGHFLEKPVDYTDAPVFQEPQADVKVFGIVTELVSTRATRFVDPEPVVGQANTGSNVPTLTGEQEVQLFLRYNYARMRLRRLQDRYVGKPLPAKATREFVAWAHRALDIRATISEVNLPLVMAMAKRTRLPTVDYNELISEGNMALLRSVDKFDCGRGFKFSTYACRAILKSFSRVAMRTSRYRGRFPTEFDPAIERSDFLERKREEVETDCVDELKDILLKNLAELSDVERTVIDERFALQASSATDGTPKTLAEVGTIIGVTKERVRQIQNKALRKIRNALEESYLAA